MTFLIALIITAAVSMIAGIVITHKDSMLPRPSTLDDAITRYPDWPALSRIAMCFNGMPGLYALLMGIQLARLEKDWTEQAIKEYLVDKDARMPDRQVITTIVQKEAFTMQDLEERVP